MKKFLIHLSILSLLAAVALPMIACAPKEKAADEQMEQPAADQGGEAMDQGSESMGDESMGEDMGDESMGEGSEGMSDDGGMMDDNGGKMDEGNGMAGDEKPADQGEGGM